MHFVAQSHNDGFNEKYVLAGVLSDNDGIQWVDISCNRYNSLNPIWNIPSTYDENDAKTAIPGYFLIEVVSKKNGASVKCKIRLYSRDISLNKTGCQSKDLEFVVLERIKKYSNFPGSEETLQKLHKHISQIFWSRCIRSYSQWNAHCHGAMSIDGISYSWKAL